jgi:4'-phosphopantetheinyl transferase EntD
MMGPAAHPDALQDVLHRALPDTLAVAVCDPRQTHAPLWPQEQPAVARARPARRREYAAGRHAVRTAMGQLGRRAEAVPSAPDRTAIWPDGLTGSISHDAESCVALLGRSRDFCAMGVDLEPHAPLPEDLIAEICTPQEWRWLSTTLPAHRALWARRIFSAKEAAFKAQFPLTGEMFGFDGLAISFHAGATAFTARFCPPAQRHPMPPPLEGQQLVSCGRIVSVVTIGAEQEMPNAGFHRCASG